MVKLLRTQIYNKLNRQFTEQEELWGTHLIEESYILMMLNKFIYNKKQDAAVKSLHINEFTSMIANEQILEREMVTTANTHAKHFSKWEKIQALQLIDNWELHRQ